jgi:hypothetical protein
MINHCAPSVNDFAPGFRQDQEPQGRPEEAKGSGEQHVIVKNRLARCLFGATLAVAPRLPSWGAGSG